MTNRLLGAGKKLVGGDLDLLLLLLLRSELLRSLQTSAYAYEHPRTMRNPSGSDLKNLRGGFKACDLAICSVNAPQCFPC